jgi:hypothetical protein
MLGWTSTSIASLMMRSMYLGLVERMVVFCSWMRCPKLIRTYYAPPRLTCPDVRKGYVADAVLQPGVNRMAPLPNVDLATLTGDDVYSWCPQCHVVLNRPKETTYIPGRQAYKLDVVPRQHPANAIEYRPDIGQENDWIWLSVGLANPRGKVEGSVGLFCLPPAFTLVSCSAYIFDPEDVGDMFLRNVG